jgi:hypothetical protein
MGLPELESGAITQNEPSGSREEGSRFLISGHQARLVATKSI